MSKLYIFDTNVLISRTLFKNSIPDLAIKKALSTVGSRLAFSNDTFNEFKEVLYRKKFDKYISNEERRDNLFALEKFSLFIIPKIQIDICSDPKDNMFLSLALECQADCIVSGDKHLLELHPFEHIPIVTPADFLHL